MGASGKKMGRGEMGRFGVKAEPDIYREGENGIIMARIWSPLVC